MKNVKQNTVVLIGSEEWSRSYTTQNEDNFHGDFLTQSMISFSLSHCAGILDFLCPLWWMWLVTAVLLSGFNLPNNNKTRRLLFLWRCH